MNKTLPALAAASILTLTSLQAAHAAEIVVGVVLPMTGPLASWAGPPQYRGIQVALDQIAASKMLGGDTIKLMLEDDASDKTQSITLTNRLIVQNNAALILGPSSSPLAAAAAPIANQNKTPMIAIAVSEEITKTGPWVYKIYQGPGPTITAAAQYLVDKLKVHSVDIVYARDNEAMVSYTHVMRDYLTAHGVKDISEETVQATETDFTAVATKLADKKVDAIFLNLLPENAANLAIQARQAGLPPSVTFVGSDQLGAQSYAKIGGDAVKGTIYPTFYVAENTKAPNPEFVAAYRKKFNAEPDQYASIGYTAMMLGATAIKNAGPNPDREKIRAALAATRDMPTVLGAGAFTFDDNRNPTYGTLLMSVDGNNPTLVK